MNTQEVLRTPSEDELGPRPGWTPIEAFSRQTRQRSFVSGFPDSCRLRVRYFRVGKKDEPGFKVGARIWFGPEAQGPPGHAHGGSMAAVLDELMGVACWESGHRCVAARITIGFRQMLPLGQTVSGEACVSHVDGRKVLTEGALLADDGTLIASGEGLFVMLPEDRLAELSRRLVGAPSCAEPTET